MRGDRTVAVCKTKRGGKMQPGERATAAEEGRKMFHDLRHVGVCFCVCSHMRPLPQALQSMEKAFVLCPDQTAQLFTTMKYGGDFPKQIVNKQAGLFLCGADAERETWHGSLTALPA